MVNAGGFSWTFGASDVAKDFYKVKGFPTTLFIDRTGQIVDVATGAINAEQFEQRLAKIL